MAQRQVQVITAREFARVVAAPENRERLLELVHGEIIEKVPTEAHGKLAALIAHFLLAFVLPRGIKAHVSVEVRHEVAGDRHNSRLPDVSLRFSNESPVESGAVMHMPDLAVEIQSPNDQPHQLREKALYYLQKGSRLVWLFYMAARQVEACTLDDGGNLVIVTLMEDDSLTGGDVLPDFRLPLRDVFDHI